MREIICVQAGQCGNQIGSKFWCAPVSCGAPCIFLKSLSCLRLYLTRVIDRETIVGEHGITEDGTYAGHNDLELERSDVYFSEATGGKYVPRAVLVDLEPGVLDVVRTAPVGKIFRPSNFVFGQAGAGNNWAKGHYTEGAELIDSVLDVIRREAENAECLQGFQLSHSLGGGTGSGLGALLLEALRDAFPAAVVASFCVCPARSSDCVVEPYNEVLALHALLEHANLIVPLDNHSLSRVSGAAIMHNSGPVNAVVANAMCGATASLRFPGQLNTSLRKLATNLVPFARLPFVCVSASPATPQSARETTVQVCVCVRADVAWLMCVAGGGGAAARQQRAC